MINELKAIIEAKDVNASIIKKHNKIFSDYISATVSINNKNKDIQNQYFKAENSLLDDNSSIKLLRIGKILDSAHKNLLKALKDVENI